MSDSNTDRIENVSLEAIEDNPFQPRQTYHLKDIDELAKSIKSVGLQQIPLARRQGDKYQLCFGHLRKRAFAKLAKTDKEFQEMPLEVRQITDEQMAIFALEENLKRTDITPIEVARAVDKYLTTFTKATENQLATMLNMSQGNISNMRRVLKLPAAILERIESGRINFTMGRELLIFEGLKIGMSKKWSRAAIEYVDDPITGEKLMMETIRAINNPESSQQYGHPATVDGILKSIDSVAASYLKTVDKTHPNSFYTETVLFDVEKAGCHKCAKMVKTHPTKSGINRWCTDLDCWQQHQEEHKEASAAAAKAKMHEDILKRVSKEEIKSAKSQNISQEISEEESADPWPDASFGEKRSGPGHECCTGCMNRNLCDGTPARAADKGDKVICDTKMTKDTVGKVKAKATLEIPEELKKLALKKAGTRSEVLDLRELKVGSYVDTLRQGYQLLTGTYHPTIESIDDPEECTERCTAGFHYAFDSEPHYGYGETKKPPVLFVCTNSKCLAKKRGAFTRSKHARGQEKKNAETAAIRKAVEATETLDRPRMKLIFVSLVRREDYYGKNRELEFLVAKFKIKRTDTLNSQISDEKASEAIMKATDALTDKDMAGLIIELCLLKLTYTGEITDYKIQTTEPLNWLGIGINIPKPEVSKSPAPAAKKKSTKPKK